MKGFKRASYKVNGLKFPETFGLSFRNSFNNENVHYFCLISKPQIYTE